METATKGKLILGVRHTEDRLEHAVSYVETLRATSVGLELPKGYSLNKQSSNYFESLASVLESKGVKIIPLDSEALREVARILVLNEKDIQEQAQKLLKKYEGSNELSEAAFEVLRKVAFTGSFGEQDEFIIHSERSKYMLEVIKREKVPIVIVGTYHAGEIVSELPDYDYKPLARE